MSEVRRRPTPGRAVRLNNAGARIGLANAGIKQHELKSTHRAKGVSELFDDFEALRIGSSALRIQAHFQRIHSIPGIERDRVALDPGHDQVAMEIEQQAAVPSLGEFPGQQSHRPGLSGSGSTEDEDVRVGMSLRVPEDVATETNGGRSLFERLRRRIRLSDARPGPGIELCDRFAPAKEWNRKDHESGSEGEEDKQAHGRLSPLPTTSRIRVSIDSISISVCAARLPRERPPLRPRRDRSR